MYERCSQECPIHQTDHFLGWTSLMKVRVGEVWQAEGRGGGDE